MPRRLQSTLVDRFNKPIAYDFYEAGQKYGPREFPWRYYYADQDTDKLLFTASWRQILSSARFLFANVPVVRGALMEQCSYSFPLRCNFKGADKAFGESAEEWLYEWRQDNNIRGYPFSAHENARLRLLGRKIDGDIGTILTGDPDDNNGFPKIQLLRAHRVGNRGYEGEMKTGRYRGATVKNGIILDQWQRVIAYHVLGDKPEEDVDIPFGSMFLTYRPDVPDSARGISEMVASVLSFADIKRLREYEMRAQQMASSWALIEKTESGYPDLAAAAIVAPDPSAVTQGTASGLYQQTYEKGMIGYYKALSGAGLEAFRPSSRPASEAQAWEDKIVSAALYGMGWDPNFAMLIKEPGGALARMILQKINRAIMDNVTVEGKTAKREAIYALGWAIDNGVLDPPSDGDFMSWEFTLGIPLISVDSGNDRQADREAYKLGLVPLRDLTAPAGHFWDELREQRQTEIVDLLNRAKAVQAMFPELSFQEAVQLFEQRTPNANSPSAGGQTAGDSGSDAVETPSKPGQAPIGPENDEEDEG